MTPVRRSPRGRHAAARRSTRGLLALIAFAMFVMAAVVGLSPAGAPAAADAGQASSSAVTVSGTGPFAGLKVTIGKTTNLVNEVVPISWTGAAPTVPESGQFQIDYLQIMQCWGDATTGPDRSQCQFGGRAGFDSRGGDFTTTRQVNYGTSLVDPKETIKAQGEGDTAFVPFRSVDGKVIEKGNANEFFDNNGTNEIPFGRTRPDGTGLEFFETQTIREASGLGCGEVVNGSPRSCWLVIVPRGNVEVNGETRPLLRSSPLSQSNWDNRLAVPLRFAPVGNPCPIGTAERRTVGLENAVEAINRWQPVLCENNGPVYGFSQVADSVARRQVTSTQPELAFMSVPVEKDLVSAERPLVYAPVTLSGLALGFLVESQSSNKATDDVKKRNGQRIPEINLTPRLVAKLLTQSYRLAVDPTVGYLKDNPQDLTTDPDFLAVNPAFKELSFTRGLPDIITPLGLSDANRQLWEYIATDQEAANFVAGQPDPWGMRVNPFYQGLSIPSSDFAKADGYCATFSNGQGPLCTLDSHPYAADMHDGARAASRGDPLSRNSWDPLATPPQYKRTAILAAGNKALIAFADTATSARYGLVDARLRNAAGNFVAPTTDALLAGYRAMRPTDTSGVLAPNPLAPDPAAYPLATITYAVTAPVALSAKEAKDYADLIRFAVLKGQNPGVDPGQLPDGYVPLPSELRTQALAAAADVQARKGPAPTSTPSRTPSPTRTASATSTTSAASPPAAPVDNAITDTPSTAGVPAPPPAAAPTTSSPATSAAPTQTIAPAAAVVPTPETPVDAGRYALVVALVVGGVAASLGALLPWVTQRLGG